MTSHPKVELPDENLNIAGSTESYMVDQKKAWL